MMAVDYLTIDYPMGQSAQALTDFYNSYGAAGWRISSLEILRYDERRVVFMQTGTTEYLVIDYTAGKPADELTTELNGYGVDGWKLIEVDLARSNVRRAILMRGPDTGTGGGIEEAPVDDLTYGRKNAIWNQVIPSPLDGGNF